MSTVPVRWLHGSIVVLVLVVAGFGFASPAIAAGDTTVAVSPSNVSVPSGGTTTVDIVVTEANGGVGAVNMSVEVRSGTVADITDVRLHGTPGAQTITIANDSDSVRISAALMNTGDGSSVTIATLTLVGETPGTSEVSLDIHALADENGNAYTITDTVGGLVRTSAPAVTDSGEPVTDPDGDGLYEDVNGDGTFNILDVAAFEQYYNSSAVQENPALFDFNGDGVLTTADIATLESTLTGATPTASPTPTDGSPISIDSVALPDTIERGEPFEIGVTVTNTGDRPVTPTLTYAFENTTVLIKDDETLAAGESERFVFPGITLETIETSVGGTVPPGEHVHSIGVADGPRRSAAVTVVEATATSATITRTPPTTGGASPPSTDRGEERQRGFFSNSGEGPEFLSNVFNLTVLGFLLSVAGIVHQMIRGR